MVRETRKTLQVIILRRLDQIEEGNFGDFRTALGVVMPLNQNAIVK
jgi:putative component of toxin-antitoxin plasmid stabilization module